MYSNQTEVFQDSLQLAFYAKKKALLAMEELVDYPTNVNLATAISNHIAQTRTQLGNLLAFFNAEGLKARHSSQGVDHLFRDCRNKLVQSTNDTTARNFIVAETLLKVEHLEQGLLRGLIINADDLGFTTLSASLSTALSQDQTAADAVATAINPPPPAPVV